MKEYFAFGVQSVWVIDPALIEVPGATIIAAGREVTDELSISQPDITVSPVELFRELDEAKRS